MKTKTQIIRLLITPTQSIWTRSALLPALLIVLLVVTGCQPHH